MISQYKKYIKYLFSKYKKPKTIILWQLGTIKFNYDISQTFV